MFTSPDLLPRALSSSLPICPIHAVLRKMRIEDLKCCQSSQDQCSSTATCITRQGGGAGGGAGEVDMRSGGKTGMQ